VQCEHFSEKEVGVLQMRTSALFGPKKLRIFQNLRCVRTDNGEGRRGRFEPVRTFFGQGGQFFAILCGRLLWTAPYQTTTSFGEAGFGNKSQSQLLATGSGALLMTFDKLKQLHRSKLCIRCKLTYLELKYTKKERKKDRLMKRLMVRLIVVPA